ncbi:LysR substrate-binding domain-containing protein [Roseiterribacter gracilis]|uniref:LysR family transcriptional regulator n=1 Tax=Roseiterribacter gracilis TaxID=2812848 RepID=A0A8S8XC11_9PROT|nr:LysR family transcriptional regulator [Rhodospirillales bacterium TMPK1]
MQFDLVDLRLFGAIAEAGSITSGAERSGLALAAASARVKAMEEMLGTPLLERGRRGVRLTGAGEALLRHARAVLAQVEQMRGELRDFARGGIRGRVRLWSNTAALEEHLPELLSAWLCTHEGIDVELEERQSQDVALALQQGRADIGVLSDWVGAEGLTLHPFRDDRLVLATSMTHPLARKRNVQFTSLADEEFVGLTAHGALAQHVDAHALRLGMSLRYRIRLRCFDAICRMVERGVGIAVLPELAVRRRRRTMKIAMVAIADDWAPRRIVVAVRKSTTLPLHAQRLLDHLLASGKVKT